MEKWKVIEGYENYLVTNDGRVYSMKSRKYLKPSFVGNGYAKVVLCKNGKRKDFLIHRLVAEAFIPNIDNLPCVNHKDENPANNCVENLEWCTYDYNLEYGNGRKRRAKTLTNGKGCKPINQYTINGEFVREWKSGKEIENETGYKQAGISACCKGKKYRQTAYGFIWRYKN